ncbi:MAG: hypothetical protein ACRDT1_12940, partial [Micromonosporaceae bacterium]
MHCQDAGAAGVARRDDFCGQLTSHGAIGRRQCIRCARQVHHPRRDWLAHQEASVTLIAMAEAWVLWALRDAGVRTRRIRPALQRLQKEFGQEYVLVAPELATDGIDVLWDFSRTEEGAGLIEGSTGQHVIREIVAGTCRISCRRCSYVSSAGRGDP